MIRFGLAAACAIALAGCSTFGSSAPITQAESLSGSRYIPLDPLPIAQVAGAGCTNNQITGSLVSALPDNAVRIAIRQISATGNLTLGPVTTGAEGNTYEVVLDYINADVTNIPFAYTTTAAAADGQNAENRSLTEVANTITGLRRLDDNERIVPTATMGALVVPVYVGIGLRLTATVKVEKGRVNLSSLGALAAAAEAERVSGFMIVQTLGITGPQVVNTLPLPSELNATTIQNSILAMGSIKAIVNDERNVLLTPRVTGIYNPFGDSNQRIINMVVSELANTPVRWNRQCPPPAAR